MEKVVQEIPEKTAQQGSDKARNRKLARFGIIFGILGLILFAYFVRKAGVTQILEGIKRLGFGFLLVLAISSTRHMVRALAWTKCFEAPYSLKFRHALEARLMGDAVGNIVPLASAAVSEPSKAAFVTNRVPLLASLSAIALENIFYSMSVVLFIFSGTTALLLTVSLPKGLHYASIAALVITVGIVPLGYLVLRKRVKFLSGAMSFLFGRGIARAWMEKGLPGARALEDRIYSFYEGNGNKCIAIFLLELCFHAAGVTEIYVTLWFISDLVAPTLLTAFILESVNRVIVVVFKFMPFRLGIDEAGTGKISEVLGFSDNIGVTLAIVRKGRDLFWTAVGMGLIVRRGFSLKKLGKVNDEAALAGGSVKPGA